MIATADRLHSVEEYYFSKKLREVRSLAAAGKPIINMGIGSPDLPPPPAVVSAIQQASGEPNANQYQSYQGLPALREAMATFYKVQFQVQLNPQSEVLPLMGSKEGIMHISMAFLNPGDEVLIPNPGYPTYSAVANLVQATPRAYTLQEELNWFPNLEKLEKQDLSRVKLMWINYPNMPTGAVAQKQQLIKLVAFAKKHQILLVNDNPYSFVLNENPTSIFAIEGANEVCLELNSLSKTFNMAGWRVGMLVGNTGLIDAVLKVKSNMDSGMYYGIQKGAITALQSADDWFSQLNAVYQSRRTLVYKLADILECSYDTNAVGMFVWAKLPEQVKSAHAFIDELLHIHDLFITPGSIFGTAGDRYIRFSLCVTEADINEALKRVTK